MEEKVLFHQMGINMQGEFRKNKKNGKGTYTWANGDKYVGEFKDQKYHEGKLTYSDGED